MPKSLLDLCAAVVAIHVSSFCRHPSHAKAASALRILQLRNMIELILLDPVVRQFSPSFIDVKTPAARAQPLTRNNVSDEDGVLVVVERPAHLCLDIAERVDENWHT